MYNTIKYLCISDIHLGHKRNKTENIVKNLREFFKTYNKKIKECKIIFIAGDIFDTLLSNNSNDYLLATEWLTELIIFCKVNNIRLRILEGTPSHDWYQAKLITNIISKLNIEVDYKYITTLYIEKMLDIGLNILYIPDEYKHKASETYEDVLKLLKENGISTVDITIMHGQFHYQLPMVKLESSHTEDNYLNLTKYFINVGHIHTPSVYSRIIANGSFDRLAHNEEEDKGAVICTIHKDGNSVFEFLKNKNAMLFKTYNYSDSKLTLDELMVDINNKIKELPDHSHVRILLKDINNLSDAIKELKKNYPFITIKVQIETDKSIKLGDNILEENKIESFTITKDNIEELLLKEINTEELTETEMRLIKEELRMVI